MTPDEVRRINEAMREAMRPLLDHIRNVVVPALNELAPKIEAAITAAGEEADDVEQWLRDQ